MLLYEKTMCLNEDLIKYFNRKLDNLCMMYIQVYFLCLKLGWAREETEGLSGHDEHEWHLFLSFLQARREESMNSSL